MFKEIKGTMSKELKKSMRMISQQIENSNREIEIIKTNQIEIMGFKTTITEMENSLKGINSRIEQVLERISR